MSGAVCGWMVRCMESFVAVDFWAVGRGLLVGFILTLTH